MTALAAVAGLALTACSGNADPSPATVTPTQTTTATASAEPTDTTDTTDTATSADPASQNDTATPSESPSPSPTRDGTGLLGRPDTQVKQAEAEGEYDLAPVAVRVGAHEGFDRVVFELEGSGKPGWYVNYTTEPRQQASGHPIDFEGQGALNVMIRGVSYPFEHPVPEDQWVKIGPVAGAAGNITGVSHETIFEGQAQFTIGLAGGEAPYSVTLLEEPTRVVVDVVNNG